MECSIARNVSKINFQTEESTSQLVTNPKLALFLGHHILEERQNPHTTNSQYLDESLSTYKWYSRSFHEAFELPVNVILFL